MSIEKLPCGWHQNEKGKNQVGINLFHLVLNWFQWFMWPKWGRTSDEMKKTSESAVCIQTDIGFGSFQTNPQQEKNDWKRKENRFNSNSESCTWLVPHSDFMAWNRINLISSKPQRKMVEKNRKRTKCVAHHMQRFMEYGQLLGQMIQIVGAASQTSLQVYRIWICLVKHLQRPSHQSKQQKFFGYTNQKAHDYSYFDSTSSCRFKNRTIDFKF